jgi:hypothetical protein
MRRHAGGIAMDVFCLERLRKALSRQPSRRGLLRTLAGVATATPLISTLSLDDANARKKRRKKKKRCKAKPLATTCAGRCGTVKNNCKKSVQCTCPEGQCCDGSNCGACLVFITSSVQRGDLDGLTGADAICQDLADAAGLPGEYLAWLSDATSSPSTRFVQATVPYKLVSGTTVANSWGDLIDGTLAHGIDLTENGDAPSQSAAWTYTLTNGTPGGDAANEHCQNWISSNPSDDGNYGRGIFSDENWTTFGVKDCTNEHALYCLQQR